MKNNSIVNNLDSHPAIALVLSLLGIGTGTGLHYFHPLLQAAQPSHEAMYYIVSTFQCFAFAGAGLAGFVAFHGWWTKKSKKK